MSGVIRGSRLLSHESASCTMRGISGASCNRPKRLPSRDAPARVLAPSLALNPIVRFNKARSA
jgi:hypothetical protein